MREINEIYMKIITYEGDKPSIDKDNKCKGDKYSREGDDCL